MSKSIAQTTNVYMIKSILEKDYDNVIYDGCPSFNDFMPDLTNAIWFILRSDQKIAGLIKLENLNFVTWIPHIVIKKEFRGKGSEEWGSMVVKYMKDKLKDVNFLVLTPYEPAKNYAERMGFKFMGMLPKSFKKNGELLDQFILIGDELCL